MKKLLFLALALVASSCQLGNDEFLDTAQVSTEIASTPSTPNSVGGIIPTIIDGASNGGNITCEEAATANGLAGGFAFTSDKIDAGNIPGTNWEQFGLTVTVTDSTFVSWTFTPPAGYCLANMAVIVKGSNDANVYFYPNGSVLSDSGLASPVNASGGSAGLSNLTFCWNLVECVEPPVCNEETAFGGATAGGGSAWWFAYDTSVGGQQPIYAGQKAVDGAYVEVVNDMINIVLGPNMQLKDVTCTTGLNKKGVTVTTCDDQQVKIEGYNTLPSERQPAGLFTLYKGRDLSVSGNGSMYYVIHLDVVVCE
jgi:hypothetical protein